MNTNVWIKTSLATVIALTVAACGSRGGDGIDILPTKSISSTVTLGNPVSASACSIAPFNNRTNVLDSGTTDTAGKVAFEVPEATSIALIKCAGGTYTPKATAGDILSVVPEGVTEAAANALTSLFSNYLISLPAGTITSAADLSAQTVNILRALGLEGISYSALVSGTLTPQQLLTVNLYAITLANNPTLAQQLATAIAAGSISSSLAASLGSALQATYASLPPAEQPATVPTPTGGSTAPSGSSGSGGST